MKMIVWPDEALLRSPGREGLRRFRETAACAELEASPKKWTVMAWPWTHEPPIRVVLEDEEHHTMAFSLNEAGIWRMALETRSVHERSADARDADARGLPNVRPLQPGHHV